MAQTVKSLLPLFDDGAKNIGLVRLRLFKPLPQEELINLLSRESIKKVIVIDRDLSLGTGGIIAQELRALLQGTSFQGEIFELTWGGIDLTPNSRASGCDKYPRSGKRRKN